MSEYMYKADLTKKITDLITEGKLQQIEIEKKVQENKELIEGNKVATKEDLKVISAQLADIQNKPFIVEKAPISYVNSELSKADVKINSLVSGSPKGVFSTLALLQSDVVANTIEGKKYTYIISTDGKWYYWNGTAWNGGGVYQSTNIADNSISRSKMSVEINKDIDDIQNTISDVFTINDIGENILVSSNALNTTRIIDQCIMENGILRKARVECVNDGDIKIKMMTKNTDGTFNFIKEITKTVKAGVNIIELQELVLNGYYLGIYSNTTKIKTLGGTATQGYYSTTGDINTNNVIFTLSARDVIIGATFTVINDNSNNLKYLDSSIEYVGKAINGNALGLGSTRIIDYKYTDPCILKKINLYAKSTGELKIKVFTRVENSNFSFKLENEINVDVKTIGLNYIRCDLAIVKGGYIGVYSSNVTLNYDGSGDISQKRFWAYDNLDVVDSKPFILSAENNRILINAITVKYDSLNKIYANSNVIEPTPPVPPPVVTDNMELKNYSNNITPLYIPTMDGTNQPLHPSVVYIPTGFKGYKYWMVQTPLPADVPLYTDRYECPHIYCSLNGIEWEVPKGLVNPIDDLTQAEINNLDYFSDPHLVFKDNKLEVWYRITHRNYLQTDGTRKDSTWIIRKKSLGGVVWQDREVMIDLQAPNNGVGDMVRSHALWWDNTLGKYRMWFTTKEANVQPKTIGYCESTDGLIWSNRIDCVLTGFKDDNWHMDMSYSNGLYHLIIYGTINLNLHYYTSTDGLNFTFVKELLRKSEYANSRFNTGLYRSVMLWNGENYMLYITARNKFRSDIMLAVGKTIDTLRFVDGGFQRRKQVFEQTIEIVNNGVISSEIKITDKGTSIGVDYDTERIYIKKSTGEKFYLN